MGGEQRRHPRVTGYAKALILGANTPGYVRDLSTSGCQVTFMQAVTAAPGSLLKIRVIAEHDPTIAPFEIELRVRWIRPDTLWWAIGGEIETVTGAQGRAEFERLVRYYAGEDQ